MERISSRNNIKVPDRPPHGLLITTEAPFWREMLGEYVRDAVEARTWNPPAQSVAREKMITPQESYLSEDVDTDDSARRTVKERTTGILSRAKDLIIAPKRRTRVALAGAIAGAALLSGFSAQDAQMVEASEEPSAILQADPTKNFVERRLDPLDSPRIKTLDVAKKIPPPPAMKAELKPKPNPKESSSHYNHHDVSDVGSSAHCAPNLSALKQIVCFEAEKRGVANQWYAIDFIVNHESTWDPSAENPNSDACGWFQFIDRRACDPSIPRGVQAQAEAGLDYMIDRYGSPAGAYDFWKRNNWY